MAEKLKCPRGVSVATQCRKMGIAVGDTIIGREGSGNWWSESRLTLIFLGRWECVFTERSRSSERPNWRSEGEVTNWTLECRDWFKAEKALK